MSSGQEILAQDEIDALIQGIGNGDVQTEAPPGRDEARQYNFSQNTRIVRGRMPTLELMNMKSGDVLSTDFSGTLTLLAEDIPMFRGTYGMSRGQQAVQVGDFIRRPRPGAAR